MISSVLISIVYSIFLFQRYLAGERGLIHDPQFWGSAFLIFIFVSIVANILITIAFIILGLTQLGRNMLNLGHEPTQM